MSTPRYNRPLLLLFLQSMLKNRRRNKRIRDPIKNPVKRIKHFRKARLADKPPSLVEIGRIHQAGIIKRVVLLSRNRPSRRHVGIGHCCYLCQYYSCRIKRAKEHTLLILNASHGPEPLSPTPHRIINMAHAHPASYFQLQTFFAQFTLGTPRIPHLRENIRQTDGSIMLHYADPPDG